MSSFILSSYEFHPKSNQLPQLSTPPQEESVLESEMLAFKASLLKKENLLSCGTERQAYRAYVMKLTGQMDDEIEKLKGTRTPVAILSDLRGQEKVVNELAIQFIRNSQSYAKEKEEDIQALNRATSSIQAKKVSFAPFVSSSPSTPAADKTPRNWDDHITLMQKNFVVERMQETIAINKTVTAASSAVIYAADKACKLNPTVNQWCEKTLTCVGEGLKSAYSLTPEKVREGISQGVDSWNEYIKRQAGFNEQQLQIPKELTLEYYQNVNELALNYLVIQPAGRLISSTAIKALKATKPLLSKAHPTLPADPKSAMAPNREMLFQYRNHLSKESPYFQPSPSPNSSYTYLFSVTSKPVVDFVTNTLLTPPISRVIGSAKHQLKDVILEDPIKHTILQHISPEVPESEQGKGH